MLLTDTDYPEIAEKISWVQGVKRNIPKISRLFLVLSSTYPKNFMKIRSRVFP